MPITSRDLLDQLADLQLTLEGYSFEQLNVEEASALNSYFDTFRAHLEEKLWNPQAGIPANLPDSGLQTSGDTPGIITSVSHDLRNPLNGILGFTDLLGATRLDPDQQRCLRAIRLASKGALEILEELLQYNRLKSGTEYRTEVAFNPIGIFGEVREYIRALLEGTPVNFELFIAGRLPEKVKGDPSKLRRILMNLLENAVKFTSNGTVELVVRSTSGDEGDVLEFELSDTGTGIPGAELPFIFKP
ncbi:MAG: HAMP domain-containing sensor histidine kinase [Robiginitalea sp.]